MTVLRVEDLRVAFAGEAGPRVAVEGVSFTLDEGETLALVGESGSGKSLTCLALLGLVPAPGVVEAGRIELGGQDLRALGPEELRALRGNAMAMVFQDPMTSLHPLLTVERQLSEVLETHRGMTRREARSACARALGRVGLAEPELQLARYPHELSGGMRQRVMIAMALLCEPRVLLADEPTTALDVTVQAQVLELLSDLQRDRGTAVLLVTHDLGVVAGQADRVAVMYSGRIAESAPTAALFARPRHPYTRALLASIPRLDDDPAAALAVLPGSPPALAARPAGCAFHPRCELAEATCRTSIPQLSGTEPGHRVACPPVLQGAGGQAAGEGRR